jgi:anaerobic magnesium-protoporphyrin IX monomethyl ester cyclase
VLLVDVPADCSAPESNWCLAYRTLIAALRERGISAAILHPRARRTRTALIEDIVASRAKIVGFTAYDAQLVPLLAFIADLRRAGLRAHVTIGGLCASADPEAILRREAGVDSVVFGEGEESLADLAAAVLNGTHWANLAGVCARDGVSIVRGPRRAQPDLDAAPLPATDDFLLEPSAPLRLPNGSVPVVASRGCYGRCSFCCVQTFYRASAGPIWRGRRASRVVDEVESATRAASTTRVTFVDENFMGPGEMGRRHALTTALELVRRGLKLAFNFGCRPNDVERETFTALRAAGLTAVSLGIESMSSEALAEFNKKTTPAINRAAIELCEELGIETEVLFIFFHPRTTLAEVRANLEFVSFVRSCRAAYFTNAQPFSELIPFSGTDLTARHRAEGIAAYADERVAFLVKQVMGVPVQLLARIRAAVGNASSLAAKLEEAERHLKMVRIPELASDLCDRLEKGTSTRGVTRAFAVERRRIHATAARFAALV